MSLRFPNPAANYHGPGWFGEKDSRIYAVVYLDRDGNTHHAHIKTSMLSGVYLSNDRIVERAPKRKPSIEQEKAALRKRLAELEASTQTDEQKPS